MDKKTWELLKEYIQEVVYNEMGDPEWIDYRKKNKLEEQLDKIFNEESLGR